MPNSPTGHRVRAPSGDLGTFTRDRFEHGGVAHDVYRKGNGPAVIVLTEMPGISPQVLGFADRLVALGCSVGAAGSVRQGRARSARAQRVAARRSTALASVLEVCVSREFTLFATGRSSPVVDWLRAWRRTSTRVAAGRASAWSACASPAASRWRWRPTPRVLAPVLSQPSLPFAVTAAPQARDRLQRGRARARRERCASEGLRVLGLRFKGDPLVPAERFAFLRERLGDGFVAIELDQKDGHPEGPAAQASLGADRRPDRRAGRADPRRARPGARS